MRKNLFSMLAALALAGGGVQVPDSPSMNFRGSKEDLKKVFGQPRRVEHTFVIKCMEIKAVDKKTALKIYQRKTKGKRS